MVNIVWKDPGRNDESWNPEAISKTVHPRRCYVIIEAAVLIPSNDYRRRLPVFALHHLVHEVGDVVHAAITACGGMFTVWCSRRTAERWPCRRVIWSGHYPGHLGQTVLPDIHLSSVCALYIRNSH